MSNKLCNKIALLESKLDFYETEFDNLNNLLIQCGFQEGIKTLKAAAYELMEDFPEILDKKNLDL